MSKVGLEDLVIIINGLTNISGLNLSVATDRFKKHFALY